MRLFCKLGMSRVNILKKDMNENKKTEKEVKDEIDKSRLLAHRKSDYVYPDTYRDRSPIPFRYYAPMIKYYVVTLTEDI